MGKLEFNNEEIELKNRTTTNDDYLRSYDNRNDESKELNLIVNNMNDFKLQNGKLVDVNLREDEELNDNRSDNVNGNGSDRSDSVNDNVNGNRDDNINGNAIENANENGNDKRYKDVQNGGLNDEGFKENNLQIDNNQTKDTNKKNQNEILANSIKLFKNEFKRLGFDEKYWRYTSYNKNFTLCSTYPPFFIIPAQFKDENLVEVAKFRHINRLPSVVYRHHNGAVIARSSQPSVGLLGRRSIEDEELLQLIYSNCKQDQLDLLEKSSNSLSSLLEESKVRCGDCCSSANELSNGNCNGKLNGTHLNGNLNSSLNNNQPEDKHSSSNQCTCKCHHKDLNNKNCQPSQSSKFFSLSDKIFENIMSYTSYNEKDTNQKPSTNKNSNRKLLILDARSFTVAFLNRAFGGGSECSEYYPNCEVDFLYLANIHAVRTAFFSLKNLILSDPYQNYFTNWSNRNSSYWLYYISNLIESALKVVYAIDHDARPVLVHCSDGWDRTSQIVSLAELMLDPFYRTINGFKILVQREWLDFGHKFADRCGINPISKNVNERSPIFIQWLDCVYQIVKQCPDYFEFNCTYLETLALYTYSPSFGTFSCNSYLERFINQIHGETNSVWSYLEDQGDRIVNKNYIESMKVLEPSYAVNDFLIWSELYENLITAEFESRFDPRHTQVNTNFIIKNQLDLTNLRKKKLFKTYSFSNNLPINQTNNQLNNQPKKDSSLRKVKSESDLTALRSKFLNEDLPALNKFLQQDNGKLVEQLANDVDFMNSDQGLDLQHNRYLNESTDLSRTCKFEGKTNRGFLNYDTNILQYQVPISVLSKIAQIANPDSSLMYSILTYVNTLHTFSVK